MPDPSVSGLSIFSRWESIARASRAPGTGGLALRAHVIAQALGPCRFSIAMLAIGAFALFVPTQAEEALYALCERADLTRMATFIWATAWWGGTTWYFARTMLRFKYDGHVEFGGEKATLYIWLVTWTPRVLGFCPFVIVAIALARAGHGTLTTLPLAAVALATGALCFWLALIRRDALDWIKRKSQGDTSPVSAQQRADMMRVPMPEKQSLGDLPPETRLWLAAHFAVLALLVVVFTVAPVHIAQRLGAPTIIVLALATWVAGGSALAYAASWLHLPLAPLLLGVAVLFSRCNDNHVIASVTSRTAHPRPTLRDDFASWRREGPYILVAAEGGGIRAAYWTASVLSRLADEDDAFARHLYGISSVSGGSLGAAVFDALVAAEHDDHARCPRGSVRACAARMLGVDALAPLLAKMLYPNLVQELLPFPASALDRGTALEEAWKEGARDVLGRNLFDGAMDSAWDEHPFLPRLFLNATWAEAGKRVVLSWPLIDKACHDAKDGCSLVRIPYVQAVHASARFPYVSPAATIEDKPGGEVWGHLVDGGYFENSGAATAEEIARAIGVDADELRIIVIRFGDEKAPKAAAWVTEITSPPQALFAARDARGSLAVKSLRALVSNDEHVADFVLRERAVPLPLGWMLSDDAREDIDAQIEHDEANDALVAKVRAWVRGL